MFVCKEISVHRDFFCFVFIRDIAIRFVFRSFKPVLMVDYALSDSGHEQRKKNGMNLPHFITCFVARILDTAMLVVTHMKKLNQLFCKWVSADRKKKKKKMKICDFCWCLCLCLFCLFLNPCGQQTDP